MDDKRVALTVSLPPSLARKFSRMAKAEDKNKSQLFRDMIRTYEQRLLEGEFFSLQRYGTQQARKHKILTEVDIEALVGQVRKV